MLETYRQFLTVPYRECPQFRILIIGKANAGKTMILRKVCNAKPDAKPIVYDAEGKEVQQAPTSVQQAPINVQQAPTKVESPWESYGLGKQTNKIPRVIW